MKIKLLVLLTAISLLCSVFIGCKDKPQGGELAPSSDSTVYQETDPVIEVNQSYVRICVGDTFTLTATAKNVENAKFSWSFDGDFAEDVISFTQTGNTATLTALKIGNTKLVALLTVNGKSYYETVDVEVVASGSVTLVLSGDVGFNNDGYFLNLSTLNTEHGDKKTAQISVNAYKNNEKINAKETEWIIEDESVVTVSSNDFSSVGEGETSATVNCKIGGETYSVSVLISVYKPVISLNGDYTVEVENADTHTFEIEGNVQGVSMGVFYNGDLENAVGSYDSQSKTVSLVYAKLPTFAKQMGDGRELTVETSLAYYSLSVNVYTKIISDKKEFDEMSALSKKAYPSHGAIWDGYFVLDNDIDYCGRFDSKIADLTSMWNAVEGSWFNGGLYGFKGVFDGKGHNIDGISIANVVSNLDYASIFGVLHIDGVVQNVSFTNATVASNSSLVCAAGGGTVKNVYVSYSSIGEGTQQYNPDKTINNYCGTFFGFKEPTATANVSNCIVDLTEAKINKNVKIKAIGSEYAEIKNAFVIGGTEEVRKESNATLSFETVMDFLANANAQSRYKKFDGEMWSIATGAPVSRAVYEKIKDSEVKISDDAVSVLVVGTSYKLPVNNKYIEIEVDNASITHKGGVLTVLDGKPTETTAKVTVKSIFNEEKFDTLNITLKAFDLTNCIDLTKESEHAFYDITLDRVYLAELKTPKDKQQAKIKDEILYYVNPDGFSVATYNGDGEEMKEIVGVAENKLYLFNCQSVTKVIADKTDLNYLRGEPDASGLYNGTITGNFVMVNDVDCSGFELLDNPGNYWDNTRGFGGVLDGREYKIQNLTVSKGGLFGTMSFATVKNISFTGVKLKATDQDGKDGSYVALLAISIYNSHFENVSMQFDTYVASDSLYNTSGLFVYEKSFDCTYKDITLDISKLVDADGKCKVKYLTELYYDDITGTAKENSTYENITVIVKDKNDIPVFAYNYKAYSSGKDKELKAVDYPENAFTWINSSEIEQQ